MPACLRLRSPTPDSRRCRRRLIPRRAPGCISWQSRTRCTPFSPPARRLSRTTKPRMATGDRQRVALLGHPVAHSLSPRMQNAAFGAAGLDWRYAAFDVPDPVAAVAALRTLGFAGANVTIPHKTAVVAACDEADGEAVNTLVFRDGRV